MRRFASLAALAAALMVTNGACTGGDRASTASLSASGRAFVAHGNGAYRAVSKSPVRLRSGDRVRVASGTARVSMPSGSVSLARGAVLRIGAAPSLLRGDALVRAGRPALTIVAAGTHVRVAGAARVTRTLGVSVGSYRGATTLWSHGRRLVVDAYRQAVVPRAGLLPARPSPLRYSARDPWDRIELGEVIDVGEELEARARGFAAQLAPGDGRTAGFYRLVLPALEREPAFTDGSVDALRSPGDTLVGSVVALSSTRGNFSTRWRSTFAFRDEGASWGLVVADQRVRDVRSVPRRADLAIGRAPLVFTLSPAEVRARATALAAYGATAPDGQAGPPPSGGSARPAGGRASDPPPTDPPRPVPAPVRTGTPLDPVLGPVVDPMVDVLNGLLGPALH